ncbi:hypothetical protein H6P81_017591 [Aristolochia fimbriata]|uniref:Uncharacterized protein n=1 Tax=Aristolochia fimbriata TaxID=158543 RepID=A0AAV7E1M5_ARIFI|nr:hypothetical protein H6P81_017591 [Aristolochia fimbriata]
MGFLKLHPCRIFMFNILIFTYSISTQALKCQFLLVKMINLGSPQESQFATTNLLTLGLRNKNYVMLETNKFYWSFIEGKVQKYLFFKIEVFNPTGLHAELHVESFTRLQGHHIPERGCSRGGNHRWEKLIQPTNAPEKVLYLPSLCEPNLPRHLSIPWQKGPRRSACDLRVSCTKSYPPLH